MRAENVSQVRISRVNVCWWWVLVFNSSIPWEEEVRSNTHARTHTRRRFSSVAVSVVHESAGKRATPITTAVPGWISLADVSWLPWLSALAPPDTAPRKNAALCAAKDRNQPLQRLPQQKQQEGKGGRRSLLLTPSFLKWLISLDAVLFESCAFSS